MWLITSFVAAVFAALAWMFFDGRHRLGELSLMLWGLVVFVLVDHVFGYEGGAFIEYTADGMIESGLLLGLAMLAPIFLIWQSWLVCDKIFKCRGFC